jgi:hypothetical protein
MLTNEPLVNPKSAEKVIREALVWIGIQNARMIMLVK